MYKITLKDVGPDRITKERFIPVDTLEEALTLASEICDKCIPNSNYNIKQSDSKSASANEWLLVRPPAIVGSLSVVKV